MMHKRSVCIHKKYHNEPLKLYETNNECFKCDQMYCKVELRTIKIIVAVDMDYNCKAKLLSDSFEMFGTLVVVHVLDMLADRI